MSERPKTCESCGIRYRVTPLALREYYNPLDLSIEEIRWLENAARIFDDESPELFTAAQFVSWLRPDLTPGQPAPHFDGVRSARSGWLPRDAA